MYCMLARNLQEKYKLYNHEWCNISLIDIHPLNFMQAPFYWRWCIMHMIINKPKTTIRMVAAGYGLWIFNASSPSNKGCISICRMPIPMASYQSKAVIMSTLLIGNQNYIAVVQARQKLKYLGIWNCRELSYSKSRAIEILVTMNWEKWPGWERKKGERKTDNNPSK